MQTLDDLVTALNDQPTMADRVRDLRITARSEHADTNPNSVTGWSADHWKVTLRRPGRQMTTHFSKGYGHNGAEPTPEEVLGCLSSDASSVDFSPDFVEWAADFGFDDLEEPGAAMKAYRATIRQADKLRAFLGDDYDEVVYNTEAM